MKIELPTLVIWGMLDTDLLAGNLEGLDEYVTDLRIHRIEDGSHWVINEQPAAVNAAIREFIEEGSVSSTTHAPSHGQ